ncbi:MAG: hypothetical protein MAG471_01379 [Acidimicrobiaceae bacterium]|nr:hypothetical protein [Acidimicrobiaceae bacterium]
MLTRTRSRFALAVLAVVLVAAACGNDDGSTVRDLGSKDTSGSASASASASGSASASASASAPSGGAAVSVGEDGGYEYASDVSSHRLVVADLCPIGDLLDAGDFAAVATIYQDGGNSVKGDGSIRTIGGFASRDDRRHGLADYYEVPTPLDDFVTSALDGSGVFEGQDDGVRSQGVEKGMRNQVMIAWVVHELNSALSKARSGDFDVAGGAVHNWDEAWAFYHGSEAGCAPFATANSRAGNFGTLAPDAKTAAANIDILDAMIEGRDALLSEDAAGADAAAAEVTRNIVITYSQATIRYASLIEGDLAAGDDAKAKEHQAEGLAFWRVIEAYVEAEGADVDAINSTFDLANGPGSNGFGDEVRVALAPAWSALGISDADIGVLQ